MAEAEANDVKAQTDRQRYAQLVAKFEISQQQYDYAVAAANASTALLQAARAAAVAAREEVSQAHAHLAERQAQLRAAHTAPQQVAVSRSRAESAQAAVKTAQAAVEQARLNLEYTKDRRAGRRYRGPEIRRGGRERSARASPDGRGAH